MKHAYLIITHNDFAVLRRLVGMLDDVRNDIYVHIDAKVSTLPELRAENSRLYILQDRIDVRWGDVSQIRCELALMRAAAGNGPYERYHIISGTHLPLKSQDVIHGFFDVRAGREVMRLWPADAGDADFKLRRMHVLQDPQERSSLRSFLWRASLKIQKMAGLRINRKVTFVKSDNWVSLTQDAVTYMLDREKEIVKRYRFSLCGDEYFAATELSLRPDLFSIDDCPELLKVDFDGANARTIPMSDYDGLCASEYLFARKFTDVR